MKQWIKLSVPVVAGLLALNAGAIPITGTIQMQGGVTLDNNDFTKATTATFATFPNAAGFVVIGTGSFAPIPGTLSPIPTLTSVFFASPLVFSPLGSQNTPIADLWSLTSGGVTYSFNLGNVSSVTPGIGSDGTQFLNLAGSGTVDISGGLYDETVANWSFSITDTGSGTLNFGFSDSNTAAPDGGMTVMMLGAALTGLGLIKRKLA
jgi:hypothetical protein